MARDTRHPPDALLCEDCGYPLSGLDTAGNCPECGRSIESSLPERRTGSACHSRRSVGPWLRYALSALRSSQTDRASIRIDREFARGLLAANVFVACAVPTVVVLAIAGTSFAQNLWDGDYEVVSVREVLSVLMGAVILGIIVPTLFAMFLLVLTLMEQQGIKLFGARRGWRVTEDVSISVCAHASIAWVVASTLATLGTLLGVALIRAGAFTTVAATIATPVTLSLAGFLVGLLWFEVLVFLGVRACKFANRPDAH